MMSMGGNPKDSRRGRKLSLQLNRLAYMLLRLLGGGGDVAKEKVNIISQLRKAPCSVELLTGVGIFAHSGWHSHPGLETSIKSRGCVDGSETMGNMQARWALNCSGAQIKGWESTSFALS